MNREDIVEALQATVMVLDGAKYKDYADFNPELWKMGEKLCKYMEKFGVVQ